MAREERPLTGKLEDEILSEIIESYDPLKEELRKSPPEKNLNFNYGQSRIVVVMSQRTWDIAMGLIT